MGRAMTEYELELATASDVGTEREGNEDCCGSFVEDRACAIVAVADGVSSYAGGEVASQMTVEVMIGAYRDEAPTIPAGQRLYRAVQQANIAIYDRFYPIYRRLYSALRSEFADVTAATEQTTST